MRSCAARGTEGRNARPCGCPRFTLLCVCMTSVAVHRATGLWAVVQNSHRHHTPQYSVYSPREVIPIYTLLLRVRCFFTLIVVLVVKNVTETGEWCGCCVAACCRCVRCLWKSGRWWVEAGTVGFADPQHTPRHRRFRSHFTFQHHHMQIYLHVEPACDSVKRDVCVNMTQHLRASSGIHRISQSHRTRAPPRHRGRRT